MARPTEIQADTKDEAHQGHQSQEQIRKIKSLKGQLSIEQMQKRESPCRIIGLGQVQKRKFLQGQSSVRRYRREILCKTNGQMILYGR